MRAKRTAVYMQILRTAIFWSVTFKPHHNTLIMLTHCLMSPLPPTLSPLSRNKHLINYSHKKNNMAFKWCWHLKSDLWDYTILSSNKVMHLNPRTSQKLELGRRTINTNNKSDFKKPPNLIISGSSLALHFLTHWAQATKNQHIIRGASTGAWT